MTSVISSISLLTKKKKKSKENPVDTNLTVNSKVSFLSIGNKYKWQNTSNEKILFSSTTKSLQSLQTYQNFDIQQKSLFWSLFKNILIYQ